jgi:hypothetical protein
MAFKIILWFFGGCCEIGSKTLRKHAMNALIWVSLWELLQVPFTGNPFKTFPSSLYWKFHLKNSQIPISLTSKLLKKSQVPKILI